MILQDCNGEDLKGTLTTEHPASSYGLPVLVVNGDALGTFDVIGWCLVEATDDEAEQLYRGGYRLPDARNVGDPAR